MALLHVMLVCVVCVRVCVRACVCVCVCARARVCVVACQCRVHITRFILSKKVACSRVYVYVCLLAYAYAMRVSLN